MSKRTFHVSISREQIIRVTVDEDDVAAGEDIKDVAEECALEGRGTVIYDDFTVEEVALAPAAVQAA